MPEVYPELGGENYQSFSEDRFDEVCRLVAARIEREATLGAQPTVSGAARRFRYIQELRSRNSGLRQDVLDMAMREAEGAYLKATLPRELVRFESQARPNDNFRVISVEETRWLETFNDPSYNWTIYFEDCGRAVAAGEKKQLTDALVGAQGALWPPKLARRTTVS